MKTATFFMDNRYYTRRGANSAVGQRLRWPGRPAPGETSHSDESLMQDFGWPPGGFVKCGHARARGHLSGSLVSGSLRSSWCVKTVTARQAKATLNALLAELERTGASVTITTRSRPVAVSMPAPQRPRRFGQLPAVAVTDTFDDPLPVADIAAWERNS
jgi:prevent-host-death family protein